MTGTFFTMKQPGSNAQRGLSPAVLTRVLIVCGSQRRSKQRLEKLACLTLGESGIQQPGRRDVRKGVSDSCIHSESDSALSLHIPELVMTQDTKIWACDLGSLFKTAGFCNNCSWIVTFKNCIKI